LKASRLHIPTLRQTPADAELAGHALLVRAGFVRSSSAGLFSLLPLGVRVIRKIEALVRREMEAIGAQEIMAPTLQPEGLWRRSGRYDLFIPPLMKLRDSSGREFCLAPTHEEAVSELVGFDLRSYRQLPLLVYQIERKFRDEIRPRGGLIRAKEFLMKDAYSFHADRDSLEETYRQVLAAYMRLFEACGLECLVVEGETGSMGGEAAEQVMLLASCGEDRVFRCDTCDYAANASCAACRAPTSTPERDTMGEATVVPTPGARTVEEVCGLLDVPPETLVKTLLYESGGRFYAVLVRGDRELNETKLEACLNAPVRMAEADEIERITGAPVGFTGPVGLPEDVVVLADQEIRAMVDFVTGANIAEAHLVAVDVGVDFEVDQYADLRDAVPQDPCPRCEHGLLTVTRGIELAHLFKLGFQYTEPLGVRFSGVDGRERPAIMGCYGLGVSRLMAALAEVHADERGLTWPQPVAPFDAAILLLHPQDEELYRQAEALEWELEGRGWDTLLDDRDERPGVKFRDADLVGYPWQVVVGKLAKEQGNVEVRARVGGAEVVCPIGEAADRLTELARQDG